MTVQTQTIVNPLLVLARRRRQSCSIGKRHATWLLLFLLMGTSVSAKESASGTSEVPPEVRSDFQLYDEQGNAIFRFERSGGFMTGIERYTTLPLSAILAIISMAALVGWWIYLLKRGWGTLEVQTLRPVGTRSYLSLHISAYPLPHRKREQLFQLTPKRDRFQKKIRLGRSREFYMIPRLLKADRLAPGHYYLYLHGTLHDSRGRPTGDVVEIKEIDLGKNDSVRVVFDLNRRLATLDVTVVDGLNVAAGAELAITGQIGSKYLRTDRPISFYLSPGDHQLLIYHKQHVISKTIKIESPDPVELRIDLAETSLTRMNSTDFERLAAGHNRRLKLRYASSPQIRYRRITEGHVGEGKLTDLSEDGMCLTGDLSLPIGEHCAIAIRLPSSTDRIIAYGRVAWSQPDRKPARIGIVSERFQASNGQPISGRDMIDLFAATKALTRAPEQIRL